MTAMLACKTRPTTHQTAFTVMPLFAASLNVINLNAKAFIPVAAFRLL